MSVLLLLACSQVTDPPERPLVMPALIDSRTLELGERRVAVFADREGRTLRLEDQGATWRIELPDGGVLQASQAKAAPDAEGPAWDIAGHGSDLGGACEGHHSAALRIEDLGLGKVRATWCGQEGLFYAGTTAEAPEPEALLDDYALALACLEDQDDEACRAVQDQVLKARGADPRAWAVGAGPVYELACEQGTAPSPRPLEVEVRAGATVELVQQHAESLGELTTQLQACAHEHWRKYPCEDAALEHRLNDPVTESDPLRACYDEVGAMLVEAELLVQLDLRITATPAPR